jgi:hypothetical protein
LKHLLSASCRAFAVSWVLIVCVAVPAAALSLGQGAATSPEAQLINSLKLQADDAQRKNDEAGLREAQKLYERILKIDPNDALARQEHDKIQAVLEKSVEAARERLLREKDIAAQMAEGQRLIAAARARLQEAKVTNRAEPLAKAREALESAKRYVPTSPDIPKVQQGIDAEYSAQRIDALERWGGLALLAVVILVPIGLYFWRPRRTLEFLDGSMPGHVVHLRKETTSIGTLSSEVDVQIPDPQRQISRHHCDVVRQGRHHFLVDQSTNGTTLNGRALPKHEAMLLKRGDRFCLGGVVTILFQ